MQFFLKISSFFRAFFVYLIYKINYSEVVLKYSGDNFVSYNEKKKEETKSIAWYLTTHITLYIVLIFFLIFFAWYTYFVVTHRYYIVYGPSMKPTLNAQVADNDENSAMDAVYVNLYDDIEVGDIVVIENVSTSSESIIKRVVAESGDYVTIAKSGDNFYLYRIPKSMMSQNSHGEKESLLSDSNAIVLENESSSGYEVIWDESSVFIDGNYTYEFKFYDQFLLNMANSNFDYYISSSGLKYVCVPEGYTLCLGDNRAVSADSRRYGFMSYENIVGNVELFVYDYSFGNRVLEVIKYYYSQVEDFFAR